MRNINSVLIANRGEIASRIIRACKKLGIKSIAVYSNADKYSPYVKEANTAIYIGNSNPNESYLDQDKILWAAQSTGADAIHPGYGFLSENADFAKACAENNIIFIGPHPQAIALMGSKSEAKTLMKEHNVPVVPGYQGKDQSNENLANEAKKIGFPILLKATAGGGGKGMRIVREEKELLFAIQAAKRESMNAFGNDELIVEKYIDSGRHIEFQIFGDQHGNAIHLLERECTIQRRHQKVVEESPSPIMDSNLRKRMGKAALSAAKALKYDNAGTVEFIYDEASQAFYFLEVNTRLQVEHPVTEEITGIDLVALQIESAQGYPLKYTQEDITGEGYAIEVRLYAEDPAENFMPATGRIEKFEVPQIEGVRVETAIQSGSEISIFYDPMIAKIIVSDSDRKTAHRKLRHVLKNLVCLGITTNQDFLLHLCEQESFKNGDYNTQYIEERIMPSYQRDSDNQALIYASIAATIAQWQNRENKRALLKSIPSGWRNNPYTHQQVTYLYKDETLLVKYLYSNHQFQFLIDEQSYKVSIINNTNEAIRLEIDGVQYSFTVLNKIDKFYIHNEDIGSLNLTIEPRFPQVKKEKIKGTYTAPMPSQVVEILVEEGQEVEEGEGLIILSSMKMENTITAEENGVVKEIYINNADNIEAGTTLMKIDKQA